jgi:predicted transcriptional regulator
LSCEIWYNQSVLQYKLYLSGFSAYSILYGSIRSSKQGKSTMKLAEIVEIIDGTIFNEDPDLDIEIKGGCGADLMSDVLASVQPDAVLLTGLCNPQVVRTAQMADVRAIIFVRGKQPSSDTIDLAEQESLPIISSPYGMFELCGRLFRAGLPSLETNMQ